MLVEEYNREQDRILVMLHGAHMVHAFRGQYGLPFHILVPHLMGFGEEAGRVFDADQCIGELAEFLAGLHRKVLLTGFSLGAQLAFRLASLHPELVSGVILVSPWLIKEEATLEKIRDVNLRQLRTLQNPRICRIAAALNGVPKAHRAEFVRHVAAESPETIRNVVYNGITLDSTPEFSRLDVPVLALAGEREAAPILDSVRALAEANPHCRYEIVPKAAHNIPFRFPEAFNDLILKTADSL